MADIQMPQLGETVTEGTITQWFKQVGDQVTEDEPLFEVSTDKVDSEVPSPVSGVISEILVGEGDTVEVGVVLARVGDGAAETPEQPAAAEPAPSAEPAPAPAPAAPQPATEQPAGPEPAPSGEPAPAGPQPAPAAAEPAPVPEGQGAPAADRTNGRLLSPVVRRLISENDLDPGRIPGSGPGGRITRNDVLAALEAGTAAAQAPAAQAPAPEAPAAPAPEAPAPPAARAAPPTPAPVTAGERDTSVPHSNMRRRTAEHMVRSKQTSAHAYATIEVDLDRVERARGPAREEWRAREGFSLTYLPFVARAAVDALREYPEVNASFGENELVVHNYVNLGIAVDLDFKGLMVPVVHEADGKRLRAVAREIASLADRARNKQLSPDDIAGGTFTITNPGPFGTTITFPIINQPQVAILATDTVKRRPVVVDLPDGGEAIAVHPVGNLTLTWDHRAFDGAYAASFLDRVRTILETRDWVAELA